MKQFPHLSVAGDSRARGVAYGEAFRERIRATYAVYADILFPTSPCAPAEIEQRAARVRELIVDFEPRYATEIEAIAEGAGMAPWQIYVLNARTEILNAAVGECTALYFQRAAVLGQTWDWLQQLEDLAVVTTSTDPDGRSWVTFGEPGMLAKIGFNDRGLGVCLNFLVVPHRLDGLPVHIVLRALLDAGDLEKARAVVARAGLGKSSHFLIADDRGGCYSVEFSGDRRHTVAPRDDLLVHTNHCIAPGAESRSAIPPTSAERLARAHEHAAGLAEQNAAAMKSVLLDDAGGAASITVHYRPEALLGGAKMGSCATIVMDLPARTMHLKKGPGGEPVFTEIRL